VLLRLLLKEGKDKEAKEVIILLENFRKENAISNS